MFKFIHAADIHLDSPLRGLEQYEGAPVQEIRDAARRALSNLFDLAISQNVAFVVISGDLYDGDWRDYNTGFFFTQQILKLRDANIPLFLISGNHDAANRMTRSLKLPENVTFFSPDRPETAILSDYDTAIHGQSFANAATYDDLSAGYPIADTRLFNIGLLHTCASGREGHDRYAPCTIEGLESKGYDYWALGHIHKREILSERPFIAFSGNIQGRHVRETGPKGCYLVTVEADHTLRPTFQPLDVFRWDHAKVDVSACQSVDDILQKVSSEITRSHEDTNGLPLALRIEITGQTSANRQLWAKKHHWTNEIRSLAIDAGNGNVWIEKVRLSTTELVAKQPNLTISDDAIGEITTLVQMIREDSSKAELLGFEMNDVLSKLPPELKDFVRGEDNQWLLNVLDMAEPLLLSRLVGTGEDQ